MDRTGINRLVYKTQLELPTVQPKVTFTKNQYEFLKVCFPSKVISGDDLNIYNKLLIREGIKAVLEMVHKHIPLDQR